MSIGSGLVLMAGLIVGGRANADQEISRGEQVFARCAACHDADSTIKAGPPLRNIVGRPAGSLKGFHYSRAMKEAGIAWDEKTLAAYIAEPQKVVPGNRMAFSGLDEPADVSALIAYLKTLH